MNFANRRARQAAFTLMEMMIVVAIVGILAAIALPAYNDQVTRSRIVDGTTKLGDFRSQMEKYFLDWRTYQTVPPAGNACGVTPPALPGGGDAFTIACIAPNATTYRVTVTGIAAKGMTGFEYDINETNLKRSFPLGPPAGWTTPVPNDCWAIRKDGSCQ